MPQGGEVRSKVGDFGPRDDAQRWLQARALQISSDLASTRWLLDVQKGTAIRTPFLVMLASSDGGKSASGGGRGRQYTAPLQVDATQTTVVGSASSQRPSR